MSMGDMHIYYNKGKSKNEGTLTKNISSYLKNAFYDTCVKNDSMVAIISTSLNSDHEKGKL